MIHTLKCKCSPVPPPKGFIDGIPHRNDKADYRGELWPVVKAFASAKVHFLGLLQKRFAGVGFDSNPPLATKNRFFCKAFPNLQPASGGERVQYGALGCASEVLDRVFPPPLLADEPLLAEVRPRWRAFAHAHVQDVECRLVMRLETRPL